MVASQDAPVSIAGAQEDAEESTENTSVEPPVLRVNGNVYECRNLDDITYAEQIQANQLLDKMSELQKTVQEYEELEEDDDEDEWGELPEPPEELERAWRRFHKRVVRYAFPEAPKSELEMLTDGQVARASSSFTNYLADYGRQLEEAEGKAKKTGNRKSRRASRKR